MQRSMLPLLLAIGAQTIATASGLATPAPQTGSPYLRSWLSSPAALLLVADEIALLDSVPDDDTAEEFVRWFWQRRDPDPSTAGNEFRAEFFERLSFVEREFADPTPSGPTWASAKGRVYLLLGHPDAVYTSQRQYFIDGALRALEIWEYGHFGAVRFAFAETERGTRLIVDDPRERLAPNQEARMESAKRRTVQDAAPPSFTVVSDRRAETLSAVAEAGYRAGGVLARVRLPLRELLGEPEDDALSYRLRVVAIRRDAAEPEELAELSLRVALDELGNTAGQSLDLALWFPDEAAMVEGIRVMEVLTGREATFAVEADTSLPSEFAVARELAQVSLGGGAGIAVAYLPTCDKRPVAVARLVVPQRRLDRLGLATQTPLLALLPIESPPPR